MNILITGVAGFLGSNIAKSLLAEGHRVVGIDNLSHGRRENIECLREYDQFDWNFDDLVDTLKTGLPVTPDIIIHLASEKIPRYSDSYNTILKNQEMIEAVVAYSLKCSARLIFASTSDIYGRNENVPFKEDSPFVLGNTDVKRWAYAVSKIHSEHFIIGAHDKYGLEYTILRLFSCYGRNQARGWWGGVQSAFIENILQGKEVEIHGSGMQSRCFTYIDDALQGFNLAITNPNAVNQTFNIGNPGAYVTMYGLYKLITGIVDKYSPVKYIPYAELGKYEDSNIKIPDITKAKSLLGFEPKWNLYDGMTETIKWQSKLFLNE